MGEKQGQSCGDQLGDYGNNVTLRHSQEDGGNSKKGQLQERDTEEQKLAVLSSWVHPDMRRKPFFQIT